MCYVPLPFSHKSCNMCYVPLPFSHKCCLPLMSINIRNAFTTKLSEIPFWIFYIVYLKLEIFLRRKVELMKMGENFYVSPIDVHRHSKCFYRQTFWDPTIYTYIYIYIYIYTFTIGCFWEQPYVFPPWIWEHLKDLGTFECLNLYTKSNLLQHAFSHNPKMNAVSRFHSSIH